MAKNGDARASAYLGISFAAPPVGDLRWRDPEPAAARGRLFRATELGPLCAQTGADAGQYVGEEDCLFLNVWTPPTASPDLRPVLVYIPGGGFVVGGGSSIAFDGTYLGGRGDVVVVAMNYRLGALGFLRFMADRGTIPGNFGVQDKIRPMEWVRDNIAAFGGDPDQVTLFGESAGAMSTGLHLFAVPQSVDLFRVAIMESNDMSVPDAVPARAAARGAEFVEKICAGTSEAVDCPRSGAWLREIPLDTILDAHFDALPFEGMPGLLVTGMAQGMLWAPTVGVAPVAGQAYEGYQPGSSPKPYVFGINQNEGTFFVPEPAAFSRERYEAALECDFGSAAKDEILGYEIDGERPYDPDFHEPDAVSGMSAPAQAMAQVITDYGLAAGNVGSATRALPSMRKANLPVRGYYFTEVSNFTYTALRRCSPETRAVYHTTELLYVFHNLLEKEENGAFVPAEDVTAAEIRLADALGTLVHYDCWSNIRPAGSPNGQACRAATSTGDDS